MTPYQAGYDAGLNGPNEQNCDVSFFNSPISTADWERGNMAGLDAKEKREEKSPNA